MAVNAPPKPKGESAQETSAPTTAPKKQRTAHYSQITIRVHENSKVDVSDLQGVMAARASDAGETLTVKAPGDQKRFKGTSLIIGPVTKSRASAEDRARKAAEKFRAAAEKAGLDPASLLA